jgi:hypothetical protein
MRAGGGRKQSVGIHWLDETPETIVVTRRRALGRKMRASGRGQVRGREPELFIPPPSTSRHPDALGRSAEPAKRCSQAGRSATSSPRPCRPGPSRRTRSTAGSVSLASSHCGRVATDEPEPGEMAAGRPVRPFMQDPLGLPEGNKELGVSQSSPKA